MGIWYAVSEDKGKRIEKYGRKVTGLRHWVLRWLDCLEYGLYFRGENVIKEKTVFEELDSEWTKLILEALEMGLNKEEIRKFLNNENTMQSQQ